MNFEKYKNKMPYPCRSMKPRIPYSEKPKDFIEYAKKLEQWGVDFKKQKKAMLEYKKEEARLLEIFKNDAFEYLGISDNPKRELLYSKAWEEGHSSGLREVFEWMEDLSELIIGGSKS